MIVRSSKIQLPKPDRKSRAGFKAHKLFDHLLDNCGFKNDADIAAKLNATAPSISRIRHKGYKVGPTMILAIYDATDLSIEQIRELL
jgi:hypothetical protein